MRNLSQAAIIPVCDLIIYHETIDDKNMQTAYGQGLLNTEY